MKCARLKDSITSTREMEDLSRLIWSVVMSRRDCNVGCEDGGDVGGSSEWALFLM